MQSYSNNCISKKSLRFCSISTPHICYFWNTNVRCSFSFETHKIETLSQIMVRRYHISRFYTNLWSLCQIKCMLSLKEKEDTSILWNSKKYAILVKLFTYCFVMQYNLKIYIIKVAFFTFRHLDATVAYFKRCWDIYFSVSLLFMVTFLYFINRIHPLHLWWVLAVAVCLQKLRKGIKFQRMRSQPQNILYLWKKKEKHLGTDALQEKDGSKQKIRVPRRNVWMVLLCSAEWTEKCISGVNQPSFTIILIMQLT